MQFPMLDKVDLLKFCQTKRQFTEGVKMVMARDMTNFQASAIDDCLKLVGICHASQAQHIWYKAMVKLRKVEQMAAEPILELVESRCACRLGYSNRF